MRNYYGKRRIKDTFLCNPISILVIAVFVTSVIIHVADYFLNVAMNPDPEHSFGMYNYSLDVLKSVLFLILVLVICLIRRRDLEPVSDKMIFKATFQGSPIASGLAVVFTSVVGASLLYSLLQAASQMSLNYGITSLRKIVWEEVFVLFLWVTTMVLFLCLVIPAGNWVLSVINILLAATVFGVIFYSIATSNTSFEDYVGGVIVGQMMDAIGWGKVFFWLNFTEDPMSLVFQVIIYGATGLAVVNAILGHIRFMNQVAERVVIIAGVVCVAFFIFSQTPIPDWISVALNLG